MRYATALIVAALAVLAGGAAQAQDAPNPSAPGSPQGQDGTLRVRLPVLQVTAQKELEDAQKSPVGVTAVSQEVLETAGIRAVSEAAEYSPNTVFTEFSARKLSNPRFRGVGSSPVNPGVTTYIDGVPQLNSNSSSIELLEVDQIEFVRGPQSSLFGRNTIGGLINITSVRPSLQEWTGSLVGPFGNFAAADVRAAVSGPVVGGRLGIGVAAGYSSRDGFTKNSITGNDLDSRSAVFAKTQLYWTPAPNWDARVILTGERARDGDFALNDLDSLRANPFQAARDFEGYTHRDLVAPTFSVRRIGTVMEVSATTGFLWWETDDSTDLDYSPLPLATRSNNENDLQFTQDIRLASLANAPIELTDTMSMRWQAGVSVFTQDYTQEAVNSYAPFVLSPFVSIPVEQTTPRAALDDRGLGIFGETTFAFGERFDATVGLRGDFEHKEAALDTFFMPAIAPRTVVAAKESFGDVSPQFTVAFNATPDSMVYATASRGYKAGGFNAASPSGNQAYEEEHSWNYEGGVKTTWFDRRLVANAAAFYLRWRDMQVNVPNPVVPGQFFIANAAGSRSAGVETDLHAQLAPGCEVFTGFGYTNAKFSQGSFSNGVDVGGRRVSNTPDYTATVGGQYSVLVSSESAAFIRAEVVFRGDHYYDDANTEGQEAYSLTHFRAGVRGRKMFAEAWVRNAFDTEYIPLAFAYPGLAPSGFLGEMGAPRTFGVRAGITF